MKNLLIILGIPGSGKDTQIAELIKRRPAKVIRVGDLVREKAKHDEKVAKDLQEGNLADDKMVNGLIDESIKSAPDGSFIISDGFPRDLEQAKWLMDYVQKEGIKIEQAMLLDVNDDIAMQRLVKRGRDDDQESTISTRFEVFHKKTDEVIEYFAKQGLLLRINGNGTPEEVVDEIKEKLTW